MSEIARFAVFDSRTGRILRTGSCPDAIVSIQAFGENEGVITVDEAVTAETHVVIGSAAVLITEE